MGVGAYCSAHGGQCASPLICPLDDGVNEPFCVLPGCSTTTPQCGEAACCEELDAETRQEEIARMLSGNIVTAEARAAAASLIAGAHA